MDGAGGPLDADAPDHVAGHQLRNPQGDRGKTGRLGRTGSDGRLGVDSAPLSGWLPGATGAHFGELGAGTGIAKSMVQAAPALGPRLQLCHAKTRRRTAPRTAPAHRL